MKCEFNWKRFGKYFLYDLKCQKRNIGPTLLLPVIAPLAIELLVRLFFSLSFDVGFFSGDVCGPSLSTRTVLFCTFCGFFVMFYPSRCYGELTDKGRGTGWLMLPASRGEKFLSMELIAMIVAPILFLTAYLITDGIICLVDRTGGGSIFGSMSFFQKVPEIGQGFQIALIPTMVAMIESAATFLVGALVIKKKRWKIVGTLLVLFGLIILFVIFAIGLSDNEWIRKVLNSLIKISPTVYDARRVHLIVSSAMFAIIVGGCSGWSWFKVKNMQH